MHSGECVRYQVPDILSVRSARDGQCHIAADNNQIDKEELEEGEVEALDAAHG